MLTAEALRAMGPAPSTRQAERNIVAAIDRTAARLGNTRSVCRKYYIHPELLDAYREGSVLPPTPEPVWRERHATALPLRQHEAEVLAFLKARLERRSSAIA
jgi:DNA topoisomerase-1